MNIQFASVGDSADLLEIYRKYIDTPITFEYTLPTLEDFSRRIEEALQFYPCLICREENQVLGYAYAHRQAERAAYQWNAELSIYLDPACTSRGLYPGRAGDSCVDQRAPVWGGQLCFKRGVL